MFLNKICWLFHHSKEIFRILSIFSRLPINVGFKANVKLRLWFAGNVLHEGISHICPYKYAIFRKQTIQMHFVAWVKLIRVKKTYFYSLSIEKSNLFPLTPMINWHKIVIIRRIKWSVSVLLTIWEMSVRSTKKVSLSWYGIKVSWKHLIMRMIRTLLLLLLHWIDHITDSIIQIVINVIEIVSHDGIVVE